MVIDFEHHYIPAELGRRLGMDPTKKEAVRTRDAKVHSQLFDMDAQIRDMDRIGSASTSRCRVAVSAGTRVWKTANCSTIAPRGCKKNIPPLHRSLKLA